MPAPNIPALFVYCYLKMKQKEAQDRQEEWRSTQFEKIERWTNAYNRTIDSMNRIAANLAKSTEEMARTSSVSYQKVLSERIERDKAQLLEYEQANAVRKTKIRDAEYRLDGRTPPLKISFRAQKNTKQPNSKSSPRQRMRSNLVR